MSYKIRKPTSHELEQLEEFLTEDNDVEGDKEVAKALIENHYFVVIEDYISTHDFPGYRGKLLLGVYGRPGLYQLYGWIDGKLVEIEQLK